jgi:hypothetical protein
VQSIRTKQGKTKPSERNKVKQTYQNKPYKLVLQHKVQSIRTKQGKTSLSEQNKVKQTYQNEIRFSNPLKPVLHNKKQYKPFTEPICYTEDGI